MSTELAIVISIIGAVNTLLGIAGAILGIVGFTSYRNERMKHKAQKLNEKEDREQEEIEQLKHQKYMNDLRAIIREENEASVAPLREKLTQVDNKLELVADGTLDTLRDRVLSIYYKCMEKGYHTQYDFENIEHMHKDYLNLGGNSFVADCVKKIKALPSEEEFKLKKKQTRKPRAKKQVLLENKKKEDK